MVVELTIIAPFATPTETIDVFDAEVIWPSELTVMIGIADGPPYVPDDTLVFARTKLLILVSDIY